MDGSITQLGLNNYLINKEGSAVSFFRNAYKNYSNYAKDTREVNFKNSVRFGQKSAFRFDEDGKFGDLVTNIVVAIDLPDLTPYSNINGYNFGYCNGVGNAIAKNIELRIGGNLIDHHTSEFLDIYGELTVKPGCKENYYNMIQKYSDNNYTTTSFTGGRIYIPLQFWFCRNITSRNSSLVFPLSSLYNSTIELTIEFRHFIDLIVTDDMVLTGAPNLEIQDSQLLIDYIILEEEERNRYINVPKQLNIINQIQNYEYSIDANTTEKIFSLKSMKYPVTELIFIIRRNDSDNFNDYFNYSNTNLLNIINKSNPIKNVRLMFDGKDRIKTSPASIFTQLEPTKVHTNTPVNKYIHVYSFALEPEKIEQPNGVCNFSELQEPQIHLTFNTSLAASTLFIYAVNYNVLISIKGSGYLLHSLSKATPISFPDLNCIPDSI
jgi:hypothetical protein